MECSALVFLSYVENLAMDNSLKCVLFIKVSGQITSIIVSLEGTVTNLAI